MTSFGGLPVELCKVIFEQLDLPSKKNVRLVNSDCNNIAYPYCFETVNFDVSERGIRNVTAIASDEGLARHVKNLVLRRKSRLRDFSSFQEWEQCVILPNDASEAEGWHIPFDPEEIGYRGVMTHQEWLGYTRKMREKLYIQYGQHRENTTDNMQSLKGQLCFRTLGCDVTEPVLEGSSPAHHRAPPPPTEDQCATGKFDEAVAKFKNLTSFTHRPTAELKHRWIPYWNRLLFDTRDVEAPSYEADCQEDNDIEALHLSIALRAIGWAKPHLPKLKSMAFRTEGPAFWGPRRLLRIWRGEGHWELIRIRTLFGNSVVVDPDGESSSSDCDHFGDYTKQLQIMHKAITGLTELDCIVYEDEVNRGLYAAAQFLFDLLFEGEKLEKVHLTLGSLAGDCIRTDFLCRAQGQKLLLKRLTKFTPWKNIKDLKLEIIADRETLVPFLTSLHPTLRRLTLANVSLGFTGDTWETCLTDIVQGLPNLEDLKLSNLHDFHQRYLGGQRLLFDEDCEPWAGDRAACYMKLAADIVAHLISARYIDSLRPLERRQFFDTHDKHCNCVKGKGPVRMSSLDMV